jgi:hypothetical protein
MPTEAEIEAHVYALIEAGWSWNGRGLFPSWGKPERRTKPMKEQVQSLMAARTRMPRHMPEANQFATVRISQRFFDYLASQEFLDWSGDWPMFIGLSLLVDETEPFEEDRDWELVTR